MRLKNAWFLWTYLEINSLTSYKCEGWRSLCFYNADLLSYALARKSTATKSKCKKCKTLDLPQQECVECSSCYELLKPRSFSPKTHCNQMAATVSVDLTKCNPAIIFQKESKRKILIRENSSEKKCINQSPLFPVLPEQCAKYIYLNAHQLTIWMSVLRQVYSK